MLAALPSQNPYVKCISQYLVWKNCDSDRCWVRSCYMNLLGLAVHSRMNLCSVQVLHHTKWVQYMKPYGDHVLCHDLCNQLWI
jgi:hypothetical protein